MTWTGVTLHENPSLRLQVPALTLRYASPVAARIGSRPRLRHCGWGWFFFELIVDHMAPKKNIYRWMTTKFRKGNLLILMVTQLGNLYMRLPRRGDEVIFS